MRGAGRVKTISKMLKENVECALNEVEGHLNESSVIDLSFV